MCGINRAAWLLVILVAVVSACGPAATPRPSDPTSSDPTHTPQTGGDPTRDKLAQVLARGTLILSTDLAYPPQSFSVDGAERASPTKCAANELTGPEVGGYDAETGKLVAAGLGVEPCFVTPPWDLIKEGGWGDRWDLAFASGALTAERMQRLYMTQPYYSTPHNFFVRMDSPVQDARELAAKQIGVCSGCTHELYLRGTLVLPGTDLEYVVNDPVIVTFASEPPALEALAAGDLDAVLAGEPVGTERIEAGLALRMLPTPAYHTQKSGYADRGSSLDAIAFLERVNEIIRALHADGSLRARSITHFGVDYATAAGAFNLAALDQRFP